MFYFTKWIGKQNVFVKNGTFTISFTYKKLIELATCKVIINEKEYELTETNYKEFEISIEVVDNNVSFEMISDTNNACYIIDLLLNNGGQKQVWTPNANEIISGAVKANSSGLEITSNTKNTKLKAGAKGCRNRKCYNRRNCSRIYRHRNRNRRFKSKGKAQIAGLLVQQVGNKHG